MLSSLSELIPEAGTRHLPPGFMRWLVVVLLRCSYKLLNTFKEDPLMIVSVDHGNKSVKTPNFLFTSGVIVSEDKPALNVD